MPGTYTSPRLRGLFVLGTFGLLLTFAHAQEPPNPKADTLPEGALYRLGSVHWRHGEAITFLALTSDGKHLVTATHDSVLRLWDRDTGKEIRRFVPPDDTNQKGRAFVHLYMQGLTRAALSQDGKMLAVALPGNVVRTWDVDSGKAIHEINSPANGVSAMAFTPNGKMLAIRGATDRVCYLYEAANGKEIRKLKPAHPSGMGGNIGGGADNGTGLAFSPDGKLIALPELEYVNKVVSGSVTLFEVETGKEIRRIEPPNHGIAAIAFSPDNKTLVFNTLSTIHVKDVDTGKEIRQIKGFFGTNQIVFAPDGQTIAIKGRDQSVRLYETKTGNLLRTIGEVPANARNFVTSSNGAPRTDVVYTSDSKTLILGGHQVPRFFEVASGKETTRPGGGHGGAVSALTISADGSTIVSRGAEGAFRAWDVRTRKEVRQFAESTGTSSVAFSPDGKLVALGHNDGTIRLLDVADGKEKSQWKAHEGTIASIVFTANGKSIATRGAYDGTLNLFDVEKGTKRKHFTFQDVKAGNNGVMIVRSSNGPTETYPLAISADGKTLATFIAPQQMLVQGQQQIQPDSNCVRLFDVPSGKEVRKITLPAGLAIRNFVFSLDGRLLVSENVDKTVSVWEVASGQERLRLGDPVDSTPRSNITSFVVVNGNVRNGPHLTPMGVTIALSRDGSLVAAPGPKHTIKVYDTSTGTVVGTFPGHDGDIASLAFASDGKSLVSGGHDTNLVAWDLSRLKLAPITPIREFKARELDDLWSDLLSSDGKRGGQAVRTLIAGSNLSVAFLKDRTPPATPINRQLLDQWLKDLGSSNFAKRAVATRELQKLDELAVPALQDRLSSRQLPTESRRRVEMLLEELAGRHLSPEQVRIVRIIEALEKIGTSESAQALEALAGGAAGALKTRQAQASLERVREKKQ